MYEIFGRITDWIKSKLLQKFASKQYIPNRIERFKTNNNQIVKRKLNWKTIKLNSVICKTVIITKLKKKNSHFVYKCIYCLLKWEKVFVAKATCKLQGYGRHIIDWVLVV